MMFLSLLSGFPGSVLRSHNRRHRRNLLTLLASVLLLFPAQAMLASEDTAAERLPATPAPRWHWHTQSTAIAQGNAPFSARYTGPLSMPTRAMIQETLSDDLYAGVRLWRGAEAHVDLLLWQGHGLNNALGIDSFPNGEAFKVGTDVPHLNLARLFVRQTINLGGSSEPVEDGLLTLPGERSQTRLTITLGRVSSKDVFDLNRYANDSRTQFMNWALMANTAWDNPSDSLGFTTGLSVELNHPGWAWRYGFFQIPSERNGYTAESRYLMWPADQTAGNGKFWRAWGMVAEAQHDHSLNGRPGVVRVSGSVNRGNFGSYEKARLRPDLSLVATRADSQTFGFALNAEQQLTADLGLFARVGWNNGQNETWMFNDTNSSLSAGLSLKGTAWHRPGDTVGLAAVASGISKVHQNFLAAGGIDIMIGDGALDYAPETVTELYYGYRLSRTLVTTFDYQNVQAPAFNRARGPISTFGVRLRWEF